MSAATSHPDPSAEPIMKVALPLGDLRASVDTCHRLAEWSAGFLTSDMPAPQPLRARISEVVYELLVMVRSESAGDDSHLELSAARSDDALTLRFVCASSAERTTRIGEAISMAQLPEAVRGWHDVLAGADSTSSPNVEHGLTSTSTSTPTSTMVTMLTELAAVAHAKVSLIEPSAHGSTLTLDARLPLAGA